MTRIYEKYTEIELQEFNDIITSKKTNFEKFMAVYETELKKAVVKYPEEYVYPLAFVPTVVKRMQVSFEKGTYNKDSRAIKATCKAFGIKHTRIAMTTFWKESEA